MTLLASQIPIIYCLMYFQSNRRAIRNQANTILQALAPQRRWSGLSRSYLRDSNELFGNKKPQLGRRFENRSVPSLEERSWMWHQDVDQRKLCPERYLDASQARSNRRFDKNIQNVGDCSTKQREELRRIMSERFMTVEELRTLLPQGTKTQQSGSNIPARRYKVGGSAFADLKTPTEFPCSVCQTEVGYEVMTHIQDVHGVNHTVINFQDAYQFIPAGRCTNENSPCGGGGGARCIQIFRAHWTLVWTPPSGTRMVAHEVPSHCQCVNVGAPFSDSQRRTDSLGNPSNDSLARDQRSGKA